MQQAAEVWFCALRDLELLLPEPIAEARPKVAALKRELDRGLEEAELVAGVVTGAFVGEAVDLLVLQKRLDAIGELDFAAGTGRDLLEHLEDAWREDVAADNGVLAGRFLGLRLLDHVANVEQA